MQLIILHQPTPTAPSFHLSRHIHRRLFWGIGSAVMALAFMCPPNPPPCLIYLIFFIFRESTWRKYIYKVFYTRKPLPPLFVLIQHLTIYIYTFSQLGVGGGTTTSGGSGRRCAGSFPVIGIFCMVHTEYNYISIHKISPHNQAERSSGSGFSRFGRSGFDKFQAEF